MNFKIKALYLGTAIVLVSSTLTASLVVLDNKTKKENSNFQKDKAQLFSSNKFITLEDFDFLSNVNKLDISKRYARDFVTKNPFIRNHATNKGDYWRNQLTVKSEFEDDSDFFLKAKHNMPINVLFEKYAIEYESYANDNFGILYLKVKATAKNTNEKVKTMEKVFSLQGFKKFTNLEDQNHSIILSNLFLKGDLTKSNSYDTIYSQYLNTDDKGRKELINKWFVLDVDGSGAIDNNSIEMQLEHPNKHPKSLKILYNIQVKTYSATLDDLTTIDLVSIENSNKRVIEIPLNFIETNTVSKTLKLSPKDNKSWSDLFRKDLRFDRTTNTITNLELKFDNTSYKLDDYIITLSDFRQDDVDKDNYLVPYSIISKADYNKGISYVVSGEIKILKSLLKK
ncbi:MAG1430 family protein [Mycoplasma crocodyli]|uniref:EF-hand domain-containing protein n=1 Tax=Mycoplasma crocodyli (strain ATCC 51981 / MP145) TaxID=512564 RepID=D5E5V2_MYCCM|nr:hypothetical protein [Mycoplasma crocodyli]ADE19362.1 conserved hypothetical protein [Mycoplasma crocodyli MP145]